MRRCSAQARECGVSPRLTTPPHLESETFSGFYFAYMGQIRAVFWKRNLCSRLVSQDLCPTYYICSLSYQSRNVKHVLAALPGWIVSDAGSRVLRYMAACAFVVFAILESKGPRNDLDIYLAAANGMWNGRDIYVDTYFDGYHYYYSPLFAAIISPLSATGSGAAKTVWILINTLLLFRVVSLMRQYITFPTKVQERWFLWVAVLVSLRFVKDNLHYGQVTLLILYLCLEGIHAIRCGRSWGAWLIALGINIKILPVVFLPYLMLRREFKALGMAFAGLLCFHFLPLLFLNVEYFNDIQRSYFTLINPFRSNHLLDMEEASFHSITTWVTAFFSGAMEHNGLTLRRHFMELSQEALFMLIQSLRLFFMLVTLWVMRNGFFRRMSATREIWPEWSWLLAMIPLIFPHQQHYAFLFTLPMLFVLIRKWLMGRLSTLGKFAVVLISIAFNSSLWLGFGIAVYNHFKVVTWAALLLILVFLQAGKREGSNGMM